MNARVKVMASEARLWVDHLAVLKAGLDLGKPDALQRIKGEIERLNGEIYALRARHQIVPMGGPTELVLQSEIGIKESHMADLASLLTSMKLSPRETDEGPTPEIEARPSRRNAVLTLELNGSISHEQAVAASQIARIHEAISRAGQAKIGRLDTAGRSGGGYREPDMPPELDELRNGVYIPWANQLLEHAPQSLDIAIKVAVFGLALDRVRRKHRLRWEKARDKLHDALDLFNKKARDYRRDQRHRDEAEGELG